MAFPLDVEVVLLDIGRFPLLASRSLQGKRRRRPNPGHVYCTRADSYAEGTVCAISFVKDVLVRKLSLPSAHCFRLGFRTAHAIESSNSFTTVPAKPGSPRSRSNAKDFSSDYLQVPLGAAAPLQPVVELEKSPVSNGSPGAAQVLPC
jgi:hypothetical protein